MAALLLLLAALCSPATSSETGCVTGMVAVHNAKRCLHEDTPPLEWDDCLASCAQAWSDSQKIREDGSNFAHSPNDRCSECNVDGSVDFRVGENIAIGQSTVDEVLKAWYDEEEVRWDYTTSRSTGGDTGHMTAVVWAATTKVGCGYNPTGWDAMGGSPHWTCCYATGGNWNNEHSTYVKPRDNSKLATCDPCHGADCAGSGQWFAPHGFCSRPSGECECKEGFSGSLCTVTGGSGWQEDCSGGWPAANTAPATSEPTTSPPVTSAPTTSPPVTSEPTTAPTTYCRAGYDDVGVRWNSGLGRITITTTHEACSARCTKFSGPQFRGGCKGYMTGMYYGMIYCRSYGGARRAMPCPAFAHPSHPGMYSGALGSIHPQSGQRNLGGNCCSNMTFVPTAL